MPHNILGNMLFYITIKYICANVYMDIYMCIHIFIYAYASQLKMDLNPDKPIKIDNIIG